MLLPRALFTPCPCVVYRNRRRGQHVATNDDRDNDDNRRKTKLCPGQSDVHYDLLDDCNSALLCSAAARPDSLKRLI